ncbi:response regulator receiver and SARP domain protein [Hymenobacter roseosalivarius DSM 11622]|uniref:Response regulator receiver and SARP domain protein n=1 Tax=Hymenobacter roseosalivarius DSM 11622 TaxID=645990 RepID=A0A1W1V4M1_9BACT|nr:response regulator [Hymenobacter roseosalivarius]SMB88285.1 response regulator receiver and SARP domain protein [Hymenobacter roseosalivarius DSM 11622]
MTVTKKLRNIVLVDDNETTCFLNNRLLSRLDVADNVLVFTRAQQAYDFFWGEGRNLVDPMLSETPALVFVDLKMPGMDGFEFLQRYSALPAEVKARTVLTVLTTSMHAADTARVAQYPDVEYLAKPLTEEKLNKLMSKRFAEV